jgi:hypothetical protein
MASRSRQRGGVGTWWRRSGDIGLTDVEAASQRGGGAGSACPRRGCRVGHRRQAH